jgi:hypothetical protein
MRRCVSLRPAEALLGDGVRVLTQAMKKITAIVGDVKPSREARAIAFLIPDVDGHDLRRSGAAVSGADATRLAIALVNAGATPELARVIADGLIWFADDHAALIDECEKAYAEIRAELGNDDE